MNGPTRLGVSTGFIDSHFFRTLGIPGKSNLRVPVQSEHSTTVRALDLQFCVLLCLFITSGLTLPVFYFISILNIWFADFFLTTKFQVCQRTYSCMWSVWNICKCLIEYISKLANKIYFQEFCIKAGY